MGQTIFPVPASGRLYTTTRFTSSGTFTVPTTTDGYLDIWAVGGGGGGGRSSNGSITEPGGGGAPGVVNYLAKMPVAAGTVLTITVGGGGNGQTIANNAGTQGTDTTIAGFANSQTVTSYGGRGGSANTGTNTQNNHIEQYYGYAPGTDDNTFYYATAQVTIGINGSFTYAQPNNCNYAGANSFGRAGYGGNQFLKNKPLQGTNSTTRTGWLSDWGVANFPLAFLHATQGSAGGTAAGLGGASNANTRFAGQGGNGAVSTNTGGSGVGGGGGGGGGSNSGTTAGAGGAASANSAAGGGGGGGSSSTGNSGNGGNGGSGFVFISGWY